MKYLKNVVSLQLDRDTCVGCGLCLEVCPHGVFALDDGKSRIIDRDSCIECGACAGNCPVTALNVESGVGCATAFIVGALTGSEPTCDCKDGSSCCG